MKNLKITNLLALVFLASALFITQTIFAQSKTKLTDPEIAHIGVTANQIDIDYSKVAKEKSTNKEVLQFAETMATDHAAVLAKATALVTKLGVTPKDNSVSKKLLSDAEKTKKLLRTKKGKDFDKAYIDNEVAYHKAVISTVESVLIPETTNAELKKLLQDILPALKAHLGHAEMLQKTINKG